MGGGADFSGLRRPVEPVPHDVEALLRAEGLLDAYRERPPYQQNDYLRWIADAKRPETRSKRIRQMLSELKDGHVYMKMAWRGNKK